MPSLSPGFTGWESQSQQISCWKPPSHPFSWLGHNYLAQLNLFRQNPNSKGWDVYHSFWEEMITKEFMYKESPGSEKEPNQLKSMVNTPRKSFFDGRSGLIWVELCTKATELPRIQSCQPCNTGLEYNIEIQQPHISKIGLWDLQGPWGNNIRGVQVLGTTENQWSPGAVHYLSHCLIATARTKKAEHRQIILSFKIWHCVLSSVQLVAAVGSFNGHRRHKS